MLWPGWPRSWAMPATKWKTKATNKPWNDLWLKNNVWMCSTSTWRMSWTPMRNKSKMKTLTNSLMIWPMRRWPKNRKRWKWISTSTKINSTIFDWFLWSLKFVKYRSFLFILPSLFHITGTLTFYKKWRYFPAGFISSWTHNSIGPL